MKITCDMCIDLMPLVLDGLASEDSRNAVMEHIASCENCRSMFDGQALPQIQDDKGVLLTIKSQLRVAGLFVLILGAAVGAMLTNSQNVFYNFMIMPVLGCLGYAVMRKRWYFMLPLIFITSFVSTFFVCLLSEKCGFETAVMSAGMYSLIYTALSCVGIVIGALLHFALRKE
ncbi:MAG: zf-HC2 domain-containing protein [Clostridia bacterium]|nr:zf-HC2 domain-containing protein [Clostridia bacterium]